MIARDKLITHNNIRKTKSLFIEFDPEGIYTLQKEDRDGAKSLYQLYLKARDPTEHKFVEDCFYDLKQWEMLCGAPFFKDHIADWRKELNLQIHSSLVSLLIEDAANSLSQTKTTSAKYLLDNYFRDKKTATKTKAPVEEVKAKVAKNIFLEDAERINLTVKN